MYFPDDLLTQIYKTNGLFARIIDMPAEDSFRSGFLITGINKDVSDYCLKKLGELDFDRKSISALRWTRLFGGALTVMLINDGEGIDEPLKFETIKSVDGLVTYPLSQISPVGNDKFSIKSKHGNFIVHRSRCLVYKNGVLPENTNYSIYEDWGLPEIYRIHKALTDAETANKSMNRLLGSVHIPVYKMKNISSILATENGEDVLLKRLYLMDLIRNQSGIIATDSTEDYDFRGISSFDLHEFSKLLESSFRMLSAVTNIPLTILLGRTHHKLSNYDRTDMENYYNYIEHLQKRTVKRNLRNLLKIIIQSGHYSANDAHFSIEFNSLWNLDAREKADAELFSAQAEKKRAQTAKIYVESGVLDSTEIREKIF